MAWRHLILVAVDRSYGAHVNSKSAPSGSPEGPTWPQVGFKLTKFKLKTAPGSSGTVPLDLGSRRRVTWGPSEW